MRATQFFEFIKAIADYSTSGNEMRLPPVFFQPMAADDVAGAVCQVALGQPINGTVEIGGPERSNLDDVVRRELAAWNDPRKVIADPHARYYGVEVTEETLVPENGATQGKTRLESWLAQATVNLAAASD
jgi:uncharacterized protein YbjT (DUF2867 family)